MAWEITFETTRKRLENMVLGLDTIQKMIQNGWRACLLALKPHGRGVEEKILAEGDPWNACTSLGIYGTLMEFGMFRSEI